MTEFNGVFRRLKSVPIWLMRRLVAVKTRVRAITAAKYAACGSRTPKQAVFVSDLPRSREAKLAYGLQQAGWAVVLLHKETPTFDATKYCVEVRQYQNPWEALRLAACYTPVVYHVFSCWNFKVAATIIRHKPGNIVFDDYDVLAGMVKEESARKYSGQIELERFCLENADGLCCRSLETQYAKRHMGYKYRGRRVFFPDYCWEFPDVPLSATPSPNSSIHVVYCGNLSIEKYHSLRLHGEGFFLDLARKVATNGIHFHLYPAINSWPGRFEEDFSEYMALACETPYFHLYHPLPPDQLSREISRYHLGVLTCEAHVAYVGDDVYTSAKYAYSMSNKIFDYIDSGLGVVIYGRKLQQWLVERIRAGIVVNREQITETLTDTSFSWGESCRERVMLGRAKYSVRRHAKRLVDFYQKVSGSGVVLQS